MLNNSTLLLVQIGFTVLTTLLLIAAALSTDALAEQRLWALGNVVTCLGLAVGNMTELRAVVHGGVSYALLGLGLGLVLRGVRQFCDQTLSWHWLLGITVVSFLIPAYFATVQPNQTARLVVTGLLLGGLNLACAITLVRGLRGSVRAMMWIAVCGFAALGLALVLRSVYQLMAQAMDPNAVSDETLMSATILVAALAQVTIAFGLIMLVAHRYAEKLNHLTLLDPLTGTLNRLGMERMGQRVLVRSRQSMRSVAVALVDADHFKSINDKYGHPVGDQVLVHLANLMIAQVRPGDLVVRYGGEEFLLLLDDTGPQSAFRIADRLRELVTLAQVTTPAGNIRYQVSIGVSNTDKSGYSLAQLILDADAAMYEAKQKGRNRVSLA